jgi:hypothetical protein
MSNEKKSANEMKISSFVIHGAQNCLLAGFRSQG